MNQRELKSIETKLRQTIRTHIKNYKKMDLVN